MSMYDVLCTFNRLEIHRANPVSPQALCISGLYIFTLCIITVLTVYNVHSSGISTSPESIPSMTSCGGRPSMVQPTLWAVPRISLTLPARVLERDFGRILRAISMISSRGTLPECLMFFSFFLSRGGSVNGSGQNTWVM